LAFGKSGVAKRELSRKDDSAERTGQADSVGGFGLLRYLVWGAQGHDRWKHTSVGWASERDEPWAMAKRVVIKPTEFAVCNLNYIYIYICLT